MNNLTKLITLDKRHVGYGQFSHRLEFVYSYKGRYVSDRISRFLQFRNEMWELFGPSCEVEFVEKLDHEPNWAWLYRVKENDFYIYLKDAAVSHYLLKEQ